MLKPYPKRRSIGSYLALAYSAEDTLRAREVAKTEEQAAMKAYAAALPDVGQISVYKMTATNDAPVGLYGRDTLDALGRQYRRGKNPITPSQQEKLKAIKESSAKAMSDYYAGSLSQSVSNDYKAGRVKKVFAGSTEEKRDSALEEKIKNLEVQRDKEYWNFSRRASYSPVRMAELDGQIATLKRQRKNPKKFKHTIYYMPGDKVRYDGKNGFYDAVVIERRHGTLYSGNIGHPEYLLRTPRGGTVVAQSFEVHPLK